VMCVVSLGRFRSTIHASIKQLATQLPVDGNGRQRRTRVHRAPL